MIKTATFVCMIDKYGQCDYTGHTEKKPLIERLFI